MILLFFIIAVLVVVFQNKIVYGKISQVLVDNINYKNDKAIIKLTGPFNHLMMIDWTEDADKLDKFQVLFEISMIHKDLYHSGIKYMGVKKENYYVILRLKDGVTIGRLI